MLKPLKRGYQPYLVLVCLLCFGLWSHLAIAASLLLRCSSTAACAADWSGLRSG